ncbi:hypothetical protein OAJ57_05175 [Alphaproteobacteria bacterium]|nr:hypothetical protein [Alphaproteobacteria bacterium]
MDTESLVILIGFMWGAYMLFKIHQRRQQTKDPAAGLVARRDIKQREMPRFGERGSITFNQTKAMQQNNFEPDKTWSCEEANLILDAVKYLRAVCRDVGDSDDGPPPLEIQNEMLRFILTEQDIRDFVRKWGDDRREEGFDEFSDDEPVLARNNQYARVEGEAKRFLIEDEPEQPNES